VSQLHQLHVNGSRAKILATIGLCKRRYAQQEPIGEPGGVRSLVRGPACSGRRARTSGLAMESCHPCGGSLTTVARYGQAEGFVQKCMPPALQQTHPDFVHGCVSHET
jgi:hypothetical protein